MTQQCLAFDCAVTGLSAAIVRGGTCLARTSAPGRDQAARLLPAIEALLKEAGVGRREIGLLAVTIGPGSFTGVRVGLATARGLALALDVPLAGLATTSVLLAQAPADDGPARLVVAAIDSRLGDWFCAVAGDETPFLATADALAARVEGRAVALIGPDAEALAAALHARGVEVLARQELPDAVCLARLALARGATHWKGQGMPRPLYLRGVSVTSPDGARRTVE